MSGTAQSPRDRLARLASAALGGAGIALAGMAAVQAWQVVARYLLNASPAWTEPVALMLLAWAMSLGAAAAVHGRQHFAFPLLVARLPAPARRACRILDELVVAGFALVLCGGGLVLLADGADVRMAGVALPQGFMSLPLAVGGGLMAIFALARLPACWRGEA